MLAARSEDKLRGLADELGGDERALAVRCDVTEWDDQQALVAARARRLRPHRRRVRERRLRRRRAASTAGDAGGVEGDGPDQRLRRRADDPRDASTRSIETKGHLLLTSSVAGRRALPGSLYSVTKHAVTAMGEAARQDFNDTGVRVTLIEPGMVDTPFFDNPPQIEALEADDIARAVMFAVQQPPHVDVNEILIRPTAQPTLAPVASPRSSRAASPASDARRPHRRMRRAR